MLPAWRYAQQANPEFNKFCGNNDVKDPHIDAHDTDRLYHSTTNMLNWALLGKGLV